MPPSNCQMSTDSTVAVTKWWDRLPPLCASFHINTVTHTHTHILNCSNLVSVSRHESVYRWYIDHFVNLFMPHIISSIIYIWLKRAIVHQAIVLFNIISKYFFASKQKQLANLSKGHIEEEREREKDRESNSKCIELSQNWPDWWWCSMDHWCECERTCEEKVEKWVN